ncbi:MAG: NAD-dependent epimerase/dehydratase family protein, partial [Myxococcales bacterium]
AGGAPAGAAMTLRGVPVLVTGGAGFLGSHLVDALVKEGAAVTAFDDLSSGRRENLASSADRIRFIEGDVRDREQVRAAIRGQKIVFHLAANADVPRSVAEPDFDFDVNVRGGHHVLRTATEERARVVFASSAAVYGPPLQTPVGEDHPLLPVSPYGAAKVAVERLGFAAASVYGLSFTAVRIFNTYGERQPRYVMFDLMRKIAEDPRGIEMLGTGEQRRSYCHVSDAVQLFVRAADSEDARGRAVNLAGDSTLSIRELAAVVLGLLGRKKTKVRFTGKSWPGDIGVLSGDAGWARKHLGFAPSVALEDGLTRLAAWLEATRGWKLRA